MLQTQYKTSNLEPPPPMKNSQPIPLLILLVLYAMGLHGIYRGFLTENWLRFGIAAFGLILVTYAVFQQSRKRRNPFNS